MAGSSVVSPERRIELNPFDVDAWNLLLRESQSRPIEQARDFYEKLVTQFPNAGRYWKAYIEHELRGKNFENVETLFSRCLIHVLNIDLWKCYVFYVRETKGHLPSFREKMAKAYDFALEKVGLDIHAGQMYVDYISFLKTVPAVGQYAENQRITAVRKVFQRAIATPLMNVEQIWNDYTAYEKSVNGTLAEKLITERNKEYQIAKRLSRMLEQMTRGINRAAISVPPRGTATEIKQVDMWKKYIAWEKSNPADTDDYSHYARRVIYAHEQALLCLGYYPDVWYEASLFMQKAASELELKGDVKLSGQMREDAIQLFERAIAGLMRESQLLYFAYADFQEERKQFDAVRKIYDKLFAIEHIDPTLAYIQLMKFARRTEGVVASRAVFKRARADTRSGFHVFIANALMEYYCSKDSSVAQKIFEFGLKKYGDEPEYCAAYVDFLTHLNEDNNTRVVFERILTSGSLPSDRAGEIWDRYLEFESLVGDLASTLKVDARRREAQCGVDTGKDAAGASAAADLATLMLIDRYKFLTLLPCSTEQLRLMGYTKLQRNSVVSSSAGPSGSNNGSSNQPGSGLQSLATRAGVITPAGPSNVMGGGLSGRGLELSGYPRPDTEQMIPFKPKAVPIGAPHTVPGGVFPAPPAASHLLTLLPPPFCFDGPFVNVDALMQQLVKFNSPDPIKNYDPKAPIENGTMFGNHRVEDIKKDMYQLLATTTDPKVALLASADSGQTTTTSTRKRRAGGDSDSEDEGQGGAADPARDIYKRRMNQKNVD